MQNVKQIFADLWLKNEVDDVPADNFWNKPLAKSFQMHIFKKKSPHAFLSIFGPETTLFSLNLHLKILYLFPYFRTKRPALFVIYRDKNISSERRLNELSIDV